MSNKVCILMSTYNGERYLIEQLQSIAQQKNVFITMLIRDDNSQDDTRKILTAWQENICNINTIGKVSLLFQENVGPARSFMKLIELAPEAEYYALADQDDVWDSDKLESAVTFLEQGDKNMPALYFCQTQLVDEKLNLLPTCRIEPKCTFYESLIVHYATGCTFVFNRALLDLARQYKPEYISMHDLWLYHLCLTIGGNIYFDSVPHIKYRQHSSNVIGLSGGWKKSLKLRWQRTINKECERSNTVIELYKGFKDQIKPEYLPTVKRIVNYKHSISDMLWLLFCRRLWCNNWRTNLSMRIALLLHTY